MTITATQTPTSTPPPPSATVTVTETAAVSATPSATITLTLTVSNTPLPTQTPEAPAVLSRNVWRPHLGEPLHIGIKSPTGGKVRVHIYNVAAERVRLPFDAEVPAGVTVDALWDGMNDYGEPCAAGVYIVSVQGAGISKVLKVVLLK